MDPARRSGPLDIDSFQAKQRHLADQTTRVPSKTSVTTHDPMARHHDREGVGADRLTYRPRCSRLSELVGDIAVRDDPPVRYLEETPVDAALKLGCAGEVQLAIERGA